MGPLIVGIIMAAFIAVEHILNCEVLTVVIAEGGEIDGQQPYLEMLLNHLVQMSSVPDKWSGMVVRLAPVAPAHSKHFFTFGRDCSRRAWRNTSLSLHCSLQSVPLSA